jgi:hypothetical protein
MQSLDEGYQDDEDVVSRKQKNRTKGEEASDYAACKVYANMPQRVLGMERRP